MFCYYENCIIQFIDFYQIRDNYSLIEDTGALAGGGTTVKLTLFPSEIILVMIMC